MGQEPQRSQWVNVAVAALTMAATLPGRTHGLGLFTEPILTSTSLSRETYGTLNLVATLLGSLLCLPIGFLLDRAGSRLVLALVAGALGLTVMVMSRWELLTLVPLAIFVLLTRGFGQSAMSVVSLAIIGRSSGGSRWAVGVYSCLVSMLFFGAFAILREVVKANPNDWRGPWFGIGLSVFMVGIVGSLLAKTPDLSTSEAYATEGRTLNDALRTGTFWAFALGTAFYGLVASGVSLFNESILKERGFDEGIFLNATDVGIPVGIPVGLAANLLGGWLATKWNLGRLFGAALIVLASALVAFPQLTAEWQVYAYAMAMAGAGGIITVCFFSVWRQAFGSAHLGRIQGAAQFLTVMFSGFGQWLFPAIQARYSEYAPLFPVLAAISLVLAVFALGLPKSSVGRSEP